jgi:hypothetical protein
VKKGTSKKKPSKRAQAVERLVTLRAPDMYPPLSQPDVLWTPGREELQVVNGSASSISIENKRFRKNNSHGIHLGVNNHSAVRPTI